MAQQESEQHSRRVLCLQCKTETNHSVLGTYSENRQDDWFHWGWTATFLRCLGCDSPTLETQNWNSEDYDPDGGTTVYVDLYPRRSADLDELAVDTQFRVPHSVRALYKETLSAIHNDAPILAAVGLRATVEAICKERAVPGRNLSERIDALVAAGMLAENHAAILHQQRNLGNEAVHEFQAPPPSELIASLRIVQTLLRTVYELPELAASVEKGRRRRGRT